LLLNISRGAYGDETFALVNAFKKQLPFQVQRFDVATQEPMPFKSPFNRLFAKQRIFYLLLIIAWASNEGDADPW